MESNNYENYVLLLKDRTKVKNTNEAGKLTSGIDKKGKLLSNLPHQPLFLFQISISDGPFCNFPTE